MTKFPLDCPPFPPLHLIQSDKETLLDLTDRLLIETIEDYELHYYNGIVDSTRWVRLKQFEDIVVYEDREALKERRLSRVSPSRVTKHPENMLSLLWSGTMRGNLDDIMYAAVNRTDEDVKIKDAYIESNVVDSAVLSTLVYPTVSDPFRGVHIKWAVNAGPSMMRSVVRCRDFVYVESTGITTTSTGERIGFQLVHSVVIPGAPELHEFKLVRGNMTILHFFRQKSEGVVETFVKAFIDLMGDMPLRVATTLSTNGLVSVWKFGEYALMKKLSLLLKQRRPIMPSNSAKLCHVCPKIISGNMVRRRTRAVVQKTAHVCTSCIQLASFTNGVDAALNELSRTTGQYKAYTYWSVISPTSSSSSIML
ncbi:Hypothetical protein PHPALM_17632 [Phytophthora palmivora]|uniref:START domain-containing protein n=1 Tax=Phytophthora palmivora TaxID=4796 RepID=A0A2P4XLX6_9STRA|nr:Hypothetical protein PHPALM_17632 [Phytophthora palmivora]